jgi:hypothetical protein
VPLSSLLPMHLTASCLPMPSYPSQDQEKKEIMEQTGLTHVQVCNWFVNQRKRHRV